jgi:S-adenosyl methyltransferase
MTDQLDARRPDAARICDYYPDSTGNHLADREAARALTGAVPGAAWAARGNRPFLRRGVRYPTEAGTTQFHDIGAALPAHRSVHEIGRYRVLYVTVVSLTQALFARGAQRARRAGRPSVPTGSPA